MREELQSLIKTLHNKNALTTSLERDAFNMSSHVLSPGEFIDKIERERKEDDCLRCGGRSFCHFFTAFAYLELNAVNKANSLLEEAIKGFETQGLKWNQAMCYQVLGMILLEEGKNQAAGQRTLQKALEILQSIFRELQIEDKYHHAQECKKHIIAIQNKLRGISNSPRTATAPAHSPPPPPPAGPLPNSPARESAEDSGDYLVLPWLPIYQDVRAGASGIVELVADSKNRQPKAGTISLDDNECTIYSLRKKSRQDHQITLTKEAESWGWSHVQGQSMNECKPSSICDGDYVLFHKQSEAQNRDIVIVSTKTQAGEYACMVKRYHADDNYVSSETSEKGSEYLPIQLNGDFQILGVVYAVAKPIKHHVPGITFDGQSMPPLSPRGEKLYQTLLLMVQHDESVAQRLIDLESKLASKNANWEEILTNAIEKLMRDRDVPLRDRHIP